MTSLLLLFIITSFTVQACKFRHSEPHHTGGLWEKASEFFDQMQPQGCKPDSITYSALITAFERGGQWRRALRAFEQMQANGCHPDATVFNSLMEVLWQSGVTLAQVGLGGGPGLGVLGCRGGCGGGGVGFRWRLRVWEDGVREQVRVMLVWMRPGCR